MLRAWATRRRAELAAQDPARTQLRTLRGLLRRAAATEFGRAHDFAAITDVAAYQRRTALRDFEQFSAEYWQRAFPWLDNVSWPGRIPAFAKSSGTTGGPSKYIPVSRAMSRSNAGAARDVLAFHFAARPDSRILGRKSVLLGGSTALETLAPGIVAGDLSGLVLARVPAWARGRSLPPPELARLDWAEKISGLASVVLRERIASINGTPSWMLLFFDQLAALRPGERLAQMFPDVELMTHGGVGFGPYRDRVRWWLEGSRAVTREVYTASEGFIAYADRGDGEGLRLVLDRGLFFEFVRPEDLGGANADRRWVADAELGVEYALVLSTNAGLWSYVLGDTVRLVERHPPRVLITGRTAWMLSVAGEHLIAAELDAAMDEAARAVGRRLVEYAAAPVPPAGADPRGGHLYAVELDGAADAGAFGRALDAALVRMNDDYAAHRGGGFGMKDPDVRFVPPGGFVRWMTARGKLGGQNKVPRVMADAAALRGLLGEALIGSGPDGEGR